ncbi:MAG: hypothetical protein ABIF19_19670 [Planctomycetota bacterium]
MAELEKNRAGLQKPVSSVFKGVPIPQDNSGKQSSDPPDPDHAAADTKPTSADNATSPSSLMARLSQSEESVETQAPAPRVATPPKPPAVNKPKLQNPRVEKPNLPQESPEQAMPVEQFENEQIVETASPNLAQTIKDRLFAAKPGANTAKQKAMVILIPVLAIIMIFMFRQVLSKSPNKTKGAANDGTSAAAASEPYEIDWKIPEPLPAVTRDPLKFTDQQTAQNVDQNGTTDNTANAGTTGAIDVRDIVYSTDKPSAVIGKHIVYVGDKVNGATIVKIDRDSVEFEKDGKNWVQTIHD